jgi:uncharacterized protein
MGAPDCRNADSKPYKRRFFPGLAILPSCGQYNTPSFSSRDSGRLGSVSKLLLFLIAVAVIYFLVSGFARKRGRSSSVPPVEAMVPCAHCGINVPRSEALEGAGRFFCSEEHRRLGSG